MLSAAGRELSRRSFVRAATGASVALLAANHSGVAGAPAPGGLLRRTVPASGQTLPAVGLGTWQAFNSIDSDAERVRLRQVLTDFYSGGGRVVDTSPMYGNAERVLGQLLPPADDWFLATKVWTQGRAAGREQMQASLRLMQRRRIELMQIHNLVDWRTHLETLREWKAAGRFQYIGITHYVTSAFRALERVLATGGIDFVQLPFSAALPDAARRLIPAARERRAAVLVNRPFEGGQLFRAVRGHRLPDWVRGFAESWGQVFLKYILAQPGVTCVIPGTGNPRHLRDNLAAGRGRLPTPAERARIERLVRSL